MNKEIGCTSQFKYVFQLEENVHGVRAGGRGAAGGAAVPPTILGNSDFLGNKRKLGKTSF